MKNQTSKLNSAIAVIAIALITTLSSCEYEYVEPEVIIPPDTVSFATDVVPIFESNCNNSGCHSSGAFFPDLTPANAYNQLMQDNLINTANPAESPFYIKITTGSMKSFISANETAIILTWIEKGALNN